MIHKNEWMSTFSSQNIILLTGHEKNELIFQQFYKFALPPVELKRKFTSDLVLLYSRNYRRFVYICVCVCEWDFYGPN